MDIEPSATWLLDQAGNPIIPPGFVEQLGRAVDKSVSIPARLRKLPVLMGYFASRPVGLNASQRPQCGWGCIDGDGMPVLTFRMQVGATMVYWVASPADLRVWKVLDRWHAARRMSLFALFPDGAPSPLAVREFHIGPEMNALRAWTRQAGAETAARFIECAGKLVVTGGLAEIATSDIAGIPTLEHVLGCMLCFPDTGTVRVRLMHNAPLH